MTRSELIIVIDIYDTLKIHTSLAFFLLLKLYFHFYMPDRYFGIYLIFVNRFFFPFFFSPRPMEVFINIITGKIVTILFFFFFLLSLCIFYINLKKKSFIISGVVNSMWGKTAFNSGSK